MKTNQNRRKKVVDEDANFVRINKFIADSGYCSRRAADALIEEGKVKVNGKIVIEMGVKVSPGDLVTVNGDPVSYRKNNTYILLNKPKNTICSADDEKGRQTVFDIVKKEARLFTVGRLDRNTTGVLLITNDGELASRLTHPSHQIERSYKVGLDKAFSGLDAQKIAKGVMLDDGMTAPAKVLVLPTKEELILTITEGKNREVRRIFEQLGYFVKKLERKEFAGLTCKGLKRGEYRHLSKYEINYLKKLVGMI